MGSSPACPDEIGIRAHPEGESGGPLDLLVVGPKRECLSSCQLSAGRAHAQDRPHVLVQPAP